MDPQTFQKVEVISKKTRVMSLIKDAIIGGNLQSGEQIVEGKIAQQFGVGQGLIREALIELEHQGFVQRTPFSGTQVPTMSFEDVMQICDMRIALEPLACRLTEGKIHPAAIQQLELLLLKEKQEVEKGNLDLFLETQLPFRQTIWRLSGNRYLEQTLERLVVPLYALYLRGMRRNEGLHRSIPRSLAHQEQILEAFRVGKFDEAAKTTENFLIFVKSALVERLR